MAFQVRAALAVCTFLGAASLANAGDLCSAPPKHSVAPPTPPTPPTPDAVDAVNDHRIHIESDGAQLDADGHAALTGRVSLSQDARMVSADSMDYDYNTGKLAVKGAVDFEDPKLRIKSDTGTYDTLGGVDFNQATFQILDRNGRGFAREMAVQPDGKVQLSQVRYTTCPVGNEDWMLQASSIDLNTDRQQGVAHGVLMRFKDIPVFYTPYLSFPLGSERKSGVLFPSFGHSTNNGYQLQVPYYFNIAPNFDLTLTPGMLSARGIELGAEFRALTTNSRSIVEVNVLPSDKIEHGDRDYLHVTNITDLQPGLRFSADIASVSDINYFSDFAVGAEQTSVTYLERRAEVLYYDDSWRIRGQFQNFQTIDNLVLADNRPYSRVPRIQAEGLFPVLNSQLELALEAEATNFLRKSGPTGVRLDVSPELHFSTRGPGYFFAPAVGYHLTQYDLQDAAPGNPSTPTRTLPYARVDAGLVFERDAGTSGQRTQTLEPRMVYSYVPYRNQDELPIFDTALPDLNLTELLRTNRYVGGDRIGDANQMALGVTTRLFDHVSGTQYLSATLGQIHYFSTPRVTLPTDLLQADSGIIAAQLPGQNPLAFPGQTVVGMPQYYYLGLPGQYSLARQTRALALVPGQVTETFSGSDIVAEVALTGYKHMSVTVDYQWNPYTSQTDKAEIGVQYHPDRDRVVNLGYRFQDGILQQWDGSFAWPIAAHWSSVGRWVYSIQDKQTIEQVAGFAYRSCCYRVEIVQRRYVSNRTGGLDTSIALQLELTGLSSVGKPADSFLATQIRGYSARDPHDSSVP